MNQDKINISERFNTLIKFIQQNCIEKKIEVQFWKMLQSHNQQLKYFLYNKLFNEYDFIKNYNWYSLNSFIDNIQKYNINFNHLTEQ